MTKLLLIIQTTILTTVFTIILSGLFFAIYMKIYISNNGSYPFTLTFGTGKLENPVFWATVFGIVVGLIIGLFHGVIAGFINPVNLQKSLITSVLISGFFMIAFTVSTNAYLDFGSIENFLKQLFISIFLFIAPSVIAGLIIAVFRKFLLKQFP
jgi:hypothetical protein